MRYLITIISLALAGCATVPKPQELLDLEVMRQSKDYRRAQEQQADLVKESDEAHKQSNSAWEDEELDTAKHWATLGTIKLRTALAIIGQKAERERVEHARKELDQVSSEHQDLQAKIQEADEQLALLAKLGTARRSAKEKEEQLKAQLTEAQQREEQQKALGEAQKKVGQAQLALKMADTVEAAKYAAADHAAALSLMTRAEAALKAGSATDASATAEMAKARAESAYAAARPQYMAAKKQAASQAQNQALQKDASAIAGITVRMKAMGDTQQLVMPILDLYKRPNTTMRPEKASVITAIGALLKKYPGYPVMVNGYTSTRVRSSQRYAVSQARAQQVANTFVSMGVEFKRMAVAGRGSDNPVVRPWSSVNDRVEVILLFQ